MTIPPCSNSVGAKPRERRHDPALGRDMFRLRSLASTIPARKAPGPRASHPRRRAYTTTENGKTTTASAAARRRSRFLQTRRGEAAIRRLDADLNRDDGPGIAPLSWADDERRI